MAIRKRDRIRRLFVAVVAMGFMAGFANLAHSEEGPRARGPISVTFLKDNKRRPEPKDFYVSKDNGHIRWRNFKDRKPIQNSQNSQYVYEMRPNQLVPNDRASTPSEVAGIFK